MKLALLLVIALAGTGARTTSGTGARTTSGIKLRSVDSVAAFSEDGRSALILRSGFTSGGGNSQSWLLISLDEAPQHVDISNVGVNGNIAVQLIDQAVCRDNAKKLQEWLRHGFFGVAGVDISACLRPGRDVVDVRKNLRLKPLSGPEINALIEENGPGNFVASPNGPLVVRLVADLAGNVVVTKPIEVEQKRQGAR